MHTTCRYTYKPDLTLSGQAANINIISEARDGRSRPKKVGFPQVKSKKNGILFLVQNSLYIHGELKAYDMEVLIHIRPDIRRLSSKHQHHLRSKGRPMQAQEGGAGLRVSQVFPRLIEE